jgi:hypothetical protein
MANVELPRSQNDVLLNITWLIENRTTSKVMRGIVSNALLVMLYDRYPISLD